MANLGEKFNVNDAPEVSGGFEPIPAGVYPAMISGSEVRTSPTSGAEYLNLTYEIIDGPYKGRLIWHILNLWNKNDKAKNIARAELGKIQQATGIDEVQDSAALHNKPHMVKVAIEPGKGGYEPKNKITGWKAISTEFPPKEAAKADSGKPWEGEKTEDEIW